jgi:hypothetical protein
MKGLTEDSIQELKESILKGMKYRLSLEDAYNISELSDNASEPVSSTDQVNRISLNFNRKARLLKRAAPLKGSTEIMNMISGKTLKYHIIHSMTI